MQLQLSQDFCTAIHTFLANFAVILGNFKIQKIDHKTGKTIIFCLGSQDSKNCL